MRIRLDVPAGTREILDSLGGFQLELPEKPWLRVQVSPLAIAPVYQAAWMRSLIDPESSSSCRVLGSTRATTIDGWPLETINIVDRDNEREPQHRLVTVYDMFGHVAAMTLRTADSKRFHAEFRTFLLPLTTSARPDWHTRTPLSVDELWLLEHSRHRRTT